MEITKRNLVTNQGWGKGTLIGYQGLKGFLLTWFSRILAKTKLSLPRTSLSLPRTSLSLEDGPEKHDSSLVQKGGLVNN